MCGHTLTSAFLCGPTLNLKATDPEQSLALLTPAGGELWREDIGGMRDTPIFTLALPTQCLIGRVNGGEMGRGGRMLARLSVPKASTTHCPACPQGAPFPAPTAPITPPGTLSSAACQAECHPAGAASGKHSHAQLRETRPHSSGVPCQTGRGDIHKKICSLFVKDPFCFLYLSMPAISLSPLLTALPPILPSRTV